MLRYVFDTTEQLRRHVHRVDGAALLFFPERAHLRHTGDPVLLEMQLPERRQQVVLRATIHSRVDGRLQGVWLQFSDQLSRALEADAAVIQRRQNPRIGGAAIVEVRSSDASARIARITDVSVGGARLGAAPLLSVGTVVELKLLSPLPEVPRAVGRARVVHSTGSEAGLQFAPGTLAGVEKMVQAFAAGWKSAITIVHPRRCCAPAPLEPPLPRVRER